MQQVDKSEIQDTKRSERLAQLEEERIRFGRLIQAFERDFGYSSYLNRAPDIKNVNQLERARLLSTRYHLLELLPKGGKVAEVGVDKGDFSVRILSVARPSSLTLIDIDLSRLLDKNLAVLSRHPTVQLIEAPSQDALKQLSQDFDWIYIDANHGYEFVRRDIALASACLKVGGLLICNDYTLWSPANMMNYGVSRAVNEFLNSNTSWEVAYFAFQGGGYHDIALIRTS